MSRKKTYEPWIWTDSLDKGLKQWNMDIRFGTWNVGSLYRAGSLVTVSEELSKYVIFSGVQIRWEGGGTKPAEYKFFYGKRNENYEPDTRFFLCAYQQLRGLSLLVTGCQA
jgi:hypothetical protein